MDFLDKNLKYFKSKFPGFYNRYSNYVPSRFKYTEEGGPNILDLGSEEPIRMYPDPALEFVKNKLDLYKNKPNFFRFQSKPKYVHGGEKDVHIRNMNALLEDIVKISGDSKNDLDSYTPLLFNLGVGIGYQFDILSSMTDIRHLVIVEPEEDMFYASLHSVDWEKVIKRFSSPSQSVCFIIGEQVNNCYQILQEYIQNIGVFNFIKPYILKPLISPALNYAEDVISNQIPFNIIALGYYDDERIGLGHSVLNANNSIPILKEHISFKGYRQKIPAIVIGNGPSLDKAEKFLKENKRNAVIFSSGTALSSLCKMGIKPDFHIEQERPYSIVEYIKSGTTEEFRKGITLLALNTVHPDSFSLFDKAGMAFKANDLGAQYLTKHMTEDQLAVTLHNCNPTVSNASIAFAIALGFTDIFLVGTDFGYPDGDKHHSKSSVHYDIKGVSGFGAYTNRSIKKLDGNFGGEVESAPVLTSAKLNVELLLKTYPFVRCYNTSEGARINGAAPVRYDDITFNTKVDKKEVVEEIYSDNFSGNTIRELISVNTVLDDFIDIYFLVDYIKHMLKVTTMTPEECLDRLSDIHEALLDRGRQSHKNDTGQYTYTLMKGTVQGFSMALCKIIFDTFADSREGAEHFNRLKKHFINVLDEIIRDIERSPIRVDDRVRGISQMVGGSR